MKAELEFRTENRSHLSDINSVKLTTSKLFSASGDKDIRIFTNIRDELSEVSFSPLKEHKYYVNVLAVNQIESLLASGSTDSTIIIWSIEDGKKITSLSHPSKTGIRSLNFSLNSQFLISGSEDGSVCLWEYINDWKLVKNLIEHEGCCNCCLITPDCELVITGSTSGDLRIWDCTNLRTPSKPTNLLYKSNCHDLGVFGGSMSPIFSINSSTIIYYFVTCGGDDLLKTWELKLPRSVQYSKNVSLSLSKSLSGHSRIVTCCDYSSDGYLIISVSMDHYLIVWDAMSGNQLASVEVENNYVNSCSISWDNSLIATGGNGPAIKLWSLKYEKPLSELMNGSESIKGVNKDNKNQFDLKGHKALSNTEIPSRLDRVISPIASVENWTTDQLVNYILLTIRLPQYNQIWYRHAITGSIFLSLTDSDLQNHLGINTLGHRKMILKVIENLQKALKTQSSVFNSNYPNEAYCPISHEVMQDPVIASDGFSYERIEIQNWIAQSPNNGVVRSPMTNQILQNTDLVPNVSLRNIIRDYELNKQKK